MTDKFNEAFNAANNFSFAEFKFDEPDYNMLMFDEDSYLEHLRVQAAGLAYYGSLAKSADRHLEDVERRYKIRYNEVYSECSDILARTGRKNNVRDIEALVQCKYEKELEQWDEMINDAKQKRDGINIFYDAWKAKGFTLNAMTQMITSGLLTPKTTISEEEVQENRRRKIDIKEAHNILNRNKREDS